jgi:PAS domain S-box-containing protein
MVEFALSRELRAPALLETRPLLAMLEQWPCAVLLFDADGRLHWCNEQARRLVKNDRDTLQGLSALGLGLAWMMAPEQLAATLSGSDLKFSAGPPDSPERYDIRLKRVDLPGTRPAVMCLIEPGSNAEETSGAGSEREQFFDAAQAGIWRWNLTTDEACVDEAWCQHLQLNPCTGSEHTSRWALQIHPDDSSDYRRRLAELKSGASPYFEDEYRILTLDSRWVWILQRGRVVARSEDGSPQRIIGICIDIDRRKREETASKANEARLATALWGARAAFWQWHLPTDVRTMSPMWYAMTRYTREQWEKLANPWLSRLHPDDREAVIGAVDEYRKGNVDSLEYEYRLKISSGEWKWLRDRARAVEWDLEGNPTVIMGVSLDIDAQKRAEMALRASEARLQTAVWGARMGLWETDLANDDTRWFDNWCAQYGIDPCEGPKHQERWVANIHPADAAGATQRYQDHLEGRQDFYDSEYRIMTAEGQWRWIYARARVTERDENNVPLRMVGVCMDVDARRRAELQKHFTQPWLETALEVARCGMWHWQAEPFEVTYTDSYYRLFGVDPIAGRAQLRFWYNNIHPDDRERATTIANNMVAGKSESYEQEYRMRCADGRWMWVLDRACAMLRDEKGVGRQMVGFVIDFTDRRAQREALRASEELFRRATMAARGMIFEVDYVSGHVKRFGAERVLGYDGEELGHSREKWVERMHPEDVARFNAARPRESTEGHSSPLEYRMKHKAGHWIWLRGAGITLTDGNGKPTRRIGFVQAIEAPEYLLPGPDSKTSG